jgi:hypothetical protein
MIADLDETIEKLLQEDLPISNGEIEIKFDQPKREWSARLSRPTINLFLYDVRENATLRQHQWEQVQGGNGHGGVQMKRTPLRVDCFYMLTTWASDPADEHRLLTRCLMALFQYPVLPEDRLIGSLQNPTFPIQARLAQPDKLTNPAEVWGALDNELRPSVSYIVTLALDPWSEITAPAVRTLRFRYGQVARLPRRTGLVEGTGGEMVDIGGTVRQSGNPQPGVSIAVKGTGLFVTSDDQGRFVLGSLPPGEYTLIAWPEKGRPVEKKIALPDGEESYDIEW